MHLDWTQIIIALVTTGLAGVGLKLTDKISNRAKEKQSAATEIRQELRLQIEDLRQEITNLKQELDTAQDELDQWKSKYYELLDDFSKAKAELNIALTQTKIGFDERTREIESRLK